MGTRLSIVIVGVGLLLAAMPASAHHSFAAEYDQHQAVTLTGTLTKLEWMNPHGWLYLDVKGADGSVVNWAIESVAANQLLRRGLKKEDFAIGSELVIKGYRSKTGRPMANGRSVTLLNGRNFFLGATDSGAPKDGAEEKPANPY